MPAGLGPVWVASRPVTAAINGLAGRQVTLAAQTAIPYAVGSFQSPNAQTWNGRALAIVAGGRAGQVKIEARGDGLRSGCTTLRLV